MQIRRVAAELLQTDRQTDITKLIIAFRNYANATETVVDVLTIRRRNFLSNFSTSCI